MIKEDLVRAINGIEIKEAIKGRVLRKANSISQQNGRNLYRNVVLASCLLMAISAVVILPNISKNTQILDQINTNQTIIADTAKNSIQASLTLHVNELSEPASYTSLGICLNGDDYIYMTNNELMNYYDVTLPIEDVLPSLKEQEQSANGYNGIWKRDANEVYFDTNSFAFANEDGTQKLLVVLAKKNGPYTFINGAYSHKLMQSEVNGVKMIIAHYNDNNIIDSYYAEFIFSGNGYHINTENLSEAEFKKALTALVAG